MEGDSKHQPPQWPPWFPQPPSDPQVIAAINGLTKLVAQVLITVNDLARSISVEGHLEMAALDDLKAADAQLQTDVQSLQTAADANAASVQSAITLIKNLQATGGVSDADAEAIVADLTQSHIGVTNAVGEVTTSSGNLSTAVTPPVVTPPASGTI